ncbi:hypothetical protein L916_07360, partial [Phytophthora nicotianae]
MVKLCAYNLGSVKTLSCELLERQHWDCENAGLLGRAILQILKREADRNSMWLEELPADVLEA